MEDKELEFRSLMNIAIAVLAEHGLSSNFTIVNNEIIFDNDREQFLYELKGGHKLYKAIYRKHSNQQWEKLYNAMAEYGSNLGKKTPARSSLEAFREIYLTDWTNDDV